MSCPPIYISLERRFERPLGAFGQVTVNNPGFDVHPSPGGSVYVPDFTGLQWPSIPCCPSYVLFSDGGSGYFVETEGDFNPFSYNTAWGHFWNGIFWNHVDGPPFDRVYYPACMFHYQIAGLPRYSVYHYVTERSVTIGVGGGTITLGPASHLTNESEVTLSVIRMTGSNVIALEKTFELVDQRTVPICFFPRIREYTFNITTPPPTTYFFPANIANLWSSYSVSVRHSVFRKSLSGLDTNLTTADYPVYSCP